MIEFNIKLIEKEPGKIFLEAKTPDGEGTPLEIEAGLAFKNYIAVFLRGETLPGVSKNWGNPKSN